MLSCDASPLPVLLLIRQRVHAVLPEDVDVATEGEHAVVRLREVNLDLLPVLLGSRAEERELPHRAEGDADSDVLSFGPVGVVGGRIVMEWFPVGTIPIPIESRPNTLLLNLEVLAQSIDHPFERGRSLRVLAYEVGALVPRYPFALFRAVARRKT